VKAPDDLSPALPKDYLRPCLLLLLREQPAHGYDLLERVGAFGFDGSDPGGLYRTLRRLEQEGFVRSAWRPSDSGPQRRIYHITRSGMGELHDRAKAILQGQMRLERFLSRYEEFVALRSQSTAAGRRDVAGDRR
jgi:PadR family transcriptional regulator PadR